MNGIFRNQSWGFNIKFILKVFLLFQCFEQIHCSHLSISESNLSSFEFWFLIFFIVWFHLPRYNELSFISWFDLYNFHRRIFRSNFIKHPPFFPGFLRPLFHLPCSLFFTWLTTSWFLLFSFLLLFFLYFFYLLITSLPLLLLQHPILLCFDTFLLVVTLRNVFVLNTGWLLNLVWSCYCVPTQFHSGELFLQESAQSKVCTTSPNWLR